MALFLVEPGPDALRRYAQIPIAFEVKSLLRIEPIDGGLGGLVLRETPVVPSYIKDYDAYDEGGPERWIQHFDLRNWGILIAERGGRWFGGATVAYDTEGIHLLGGRQDLAALWDLRVDPDHRRQGIGAALLQGAADWARARGCVQLKIETQNVNVPACRFYANQGCHLDAIDRYGYANHPQVGHEVELMWYLQLA